MGVYLGIEFGSTRIKATAIDETFRPVCQGEYTWRSSYENGVWTYDLSEAIEGLRQALSPIRPIASQVRSVGISGMMHGSLAFDRDFRLLVPFRTWQNTMTATAAQELSEAFAFNVPQRWSVAHLYQALLNGEEHVTQIAHITTLSGYIHYLLTGVNAVGIGEASGIFPIDSEQVCYDADMMDKFDCLAKRYAPGWSIKDVLPRILVAGQSAGCLSAEGAALIGGVLPQGTPFAPPEGDGPTGMVATNAVMPGTGNVSAGTSIFSMVVLRRPLAHVYPEIDVITTPTGRDVAMVHCNNCTADSNAWVRLLREAGELFGARPSTEELYTKLYRLSLEGDADAGGVTVCNYVAGEGVTHLDAGMPLVVRRPGAVLSLANFLRATLYSAIATLKMGMEILDAEGVRIDSLVGHGGFFKTAGVGQGYLAAGCHTPVTCMETAGEGGSYGMALLAAYLFSEDSLEDFLQKRVFCDAVKTTVLPDPETEEGFERYMKEYKRLLAVEKRAVEAFLEETI